MKRQKRLTKRERKALAPPRPAAPAHQHGHIHCVACGKHLDAAEFTGAATATWVECLHRSKFASCVDCIAFTKRLLAEHDRTGQPVQSAPAWH